MFSGPPALIQFANPCFKLVNFLINNILNFRFLNQYIIDRAHKQGEECNTYEFQAHLK